MRLRSSVRVGLRFTLASGRASTASPTGSALIRGRKPRRSVAADQSGEPALDLHAALVVALRLVAAVRRIEADHAALAAIGFERGFLIVDQRHDDLAVPRRVDLANQREIAVENAFLDHRIAGDLERVMFAWSKQRRRNREGFGTLQGLDWRSCRDPPVERNVHDVICRGRGDRTNWRDCRRTAAFRYLHHFKRAGPVRQPPDEAALL